MDPSQFYYIQEETADSNTRPTSPASGLHAVAEAAKTSLDQIEKKLKSNATTQKDLLKCSSQCNEKGRRRGRPGTPSGTPSEFVACAEFKNGKLVRIKKEIDSRFNSSLQGGKGTSYRKSCLELFASSPTKGCKTQTKMHFECDGRSYEFLEQHGHKMLPDNFNQIFNQMINNTFSNSKAFGNYNEFVESMRRHSDLEGENSNETAASCNPSFEVCFVVRYD